MAADDDGTGTAPAKMRSDRPRDAATLVLIDHSTGSPRVLMGRRRYDQVFLPNKYVFPGGRVDRSDARAPSCDELRPSEVAKLLVQMRGDPSPARIRALAMAAIRETFEETGLLLGAPDTAQRAPERGAWQSFLAHGIVPRLACLTFIARAITPPGRSRRYDTRFFLADVSAIAHRVEQTDGELSNIDWHGLDEARGLDLPGITRVVVEDLADRLNDGKGGHGSAAVPFYFHRKGAFERLLISSNAARPPPAASDIDP